MISLGLRDLTGTYEASALGTMFLNTTLGAVKYDGSALAAGGAGDDGPSYSEINRGAISSIGIGYNATDFKGIIFTTAINGADFSPDPAIFPREPIITLMRNHLEFLDADRTFLVNTANLFALSSTLTLDYAGGTTLGAFVLFNPMVVYQQNAFFFGMGNLFNAIGTFTNPDGLVRSMSNLFSFVGQNRVQAWNAAITHAQLLDFLSQPVYQVVGTGTGTLLNGWFHFATRGAFNAGWTSDAARISFEAGDVGGTGILNGGHYGFNCLDFRKATTGNNIAYRSLMNTAANTWAFRGMGTARADFGGIVGLGIGATVDWEISRVAANLASLADGDSLRITTGAMFFGSTGSVALASSAANRLDLATGDDFRIVGGALQFAGAAEQITRTAGELLLTAAVIRTTAELRAGGLLRSNAARFVQRREISGVTTLSAATDHVVLCETSGGAFTVTLPAVAGNAGLVYLIKNIGTNTLTVDANAAEVIDGATTAVLSVQYEAITIVCDGVEWWIV